MQPTAKFRQSTHHQAPEQFYLLAQDESPKLAQARLPASLADGTSPEIATQVTVTETFDGTGNDLIALANPSTGFNTVYATLSGANDILRLSFIAGQEPIVRQVDAGDGRDMLIVDQRAASATLLDLTNRNFQPTQPEDMFSIQFLLLGFERLHFIGSAGDDTITGAGSRNTLFGGAGNDRLDAGGGVDLVDAGAGNDVVIGIGWEDTAHGGRGQDYVQLDLRRADHGVRFAPGESPDHLTGFEYIWGTMTPFDDFVKLDTLIGDLRGGAGNDTLVMDYSEVDRQNLTFDLSSGRYKYVPTPSYWPAESSVANLSGWEHFGITGTRHRDEIRTAGGQDTIFGGGGHDVIRSGSGNDLVYGGSGRDNLAASRLTGEADTIYGGTGRDIIYFAGIDSEIHGGDGYDTLNYLSLEDRTTGINLATNGGQWLDGIERLDTARLTDHDDKVLVTLGGPQLININAGAGNDLLRLDLSNESGRAEVYLGSNGLAIEYRDAGRAFTLFSGRNFERADLTGTARRDFLIGVAGNDTLTGLDGLDTLQGQGGDDRIYGGASQDICVGGAGNDIIDLGSGPDVLVYFGARDQGRDIIEDFNAATNMIVFAEAQRPVDLHIFDRGEDRILRWSNGTIVLRDMAGETIDVFADPLIRNWLELP